MNLSQRHHYLPEVYLKGFTDSDGKLAVYDIRNKELKKVRFSPKQVFFEWNRNTFEINSEKTDFLELSYRNIDQNVAPTLKKLQRTSSDVELSTYDIINLIFFQGMTYWRVPSTDLEIINHVKTTDKKELFIKLINPLTNEEANDEIYNRLLKEQLFIESFRIPKAIGDFLKATNKYVLENWKITYPSRHSKLHLIGDNPILTLEDDFDNILETESIFPLSSSKNLWHLNSVFPESISPETTVMIDKMIFLQSERYVCGPDANYLKTIAEMCDNQLLNDNIIKCLKLKIFGKI